MVLGVVGVHAELQSHWHVLGDSHLQLLQLQVRNEIVTHQASTGQAQMLKVVLCAC